MSGTTNVDLASGTQDTWPSLTADIDRSRSMQPSLRDLVEELVDERLAESTAERKELKKEARWMSVRVLTLEQALKKSREESEALSQYLQLCFDEIRAQEDRLSPRLATIEGETLKLSSRASKVDIDNIELRQETREALSKIDALSSELFELIFDAKSVAMEARGSADAVASQADELVVGIRQAHEHFASLEGRTDEISSDLESTVEAAELLASGLSEAAKATVLAHAAAVDARKQAEGVAGLSGELRNDLVQRTEALRKELDRKASVEDLDVLDTAERERIDALRVDLEQRTKALVDELGVKASMADLEQRTEALVDELGVKASMADLEQRTEALVYEIAAKASVAEMDSHDHAVRERVDALRVDLEQRTQALREEVATKASIEDLSMLEEADRLLLPADDALSDELRSYLEQNTAALREEISRMAPAEKLQALEEADRALEEELKATSELTEEARVLAEKARDRAEYASDATDELRADFDDLPEQRPYGDVTEAEASEALEDLRSEVTSSLEALRTRVDERLNDYTAQVVAESQVAQDHVVAPEARRKRWHAHLRGGSDAEQTPDSPKALPSET